MNEEESIKILEYYKNILDLYKNKVFYIMDESEEDWYTNFIKFNDNFEETFKILNTTKLQMSWKRTCIKLLISEMNMLCQVINDYLRENTDYEYFSEMHNKILITALKILEFIKDKSNAS